MGGGKPGTTTEQSRSSATPRTALPSEQSPLNGQTVQPCEQIPSPCAESCPHGVPPKETMIQLTQEALLALIHDASTRVAAQAMAQFAAQQSINPPPLLPRRSRELSSAPEEEEQRQEEINSRVSRPKVAQTQEQYPPPPIVATHDSPPIKGSGGHLFGICRRSPRVQPLFRCNFSGSTSTGVKVSNLSEYNETGDLQEHLDKFLC
ncbi:UNVERIFIED_CONTAM: hypothetical protein Sangu_1996500 [Sesamum angustifolium]|uniref:Uncharacterized protein n=1 Tax=Sesamum angustifolium TaxID=2727405 RepID=A0AAW2LI31_9LAMI